MAAKRKPAVPGRGPGRPKGTGPIKWDPKYVRMARLFCERGATNVELADLFGVRVNTIGLWRVEHPDFAEALKAGKDYADDEVERALFSKARGYTYDTVKVFNNNGEAMVVPMREHVPPDTVACIFWLKNRRRMKWTQTGNMESDEEAPMPATVTVEVVDASVSRDD